jgi:hypothetical protein
MSPFRISGYIIFPVSFAVSTDLPQHRTRRRPLHWVPSLADLSKHFLPNVSGVSRAPFSMALEG